MLERLRLLPTVMLCAALLLGLKAAHLVGGFEDVLAVSTARANEAGAPAEGDKAAGGEGAQVKNPELSDDANKAALKSQAEQLKDQKMTPAEVAVLESLSARREELDKRAKDLDLREQLLSAAQKRVEDRIAELKAIEDKINTQIADNDKAHDDQMAGLVKMYETMKPKEAARIFERLDMGVLIDVAKRMQPRKMSAVLAAMDPVAAQELTVELATGDKLPDVPADQDKGKVAPVGAAPQAAVPAVAAPIAAAGGQQG
jgi:flagellar motility protein MotE (MotC chaperone)